MALVRPFSRLVASSVVALVALLAGVDGRAEPRSLVRLADEGAETDTTIRPPIPPAPPSGTTITFPYQQKRFLHARNPNGALAYVPQGTPAGATLPIVVFLHGMNADGQVHPWFGPPYGDLRKVVEPLVSSGKVQPFILAAPTHTRQANAAAVMWPAFDLEDFVDATEIALDGVAHVDRSQLFVIATSGGGCNPNGGILGPGVRNAMPNVVVAIDTCVDDRVIPEFVTLAEATDLRIYWQRGWPRPISELARACEHCNIEEIDGFAPKTNAHLAIVPEATRRALAAILPGTTD